ncbi:MAG: sigma-70 family RNA polymerase sigma factor [Phaeodactylibacter sp.]|nr:sigma-70 family RNA polymerase sigma factor [Phaeodactylibacter sp.]MCB9048765.1 sigma-70 family RNA polymerase sigma factor [Lewinellaceae bacterium]
MPEEKINLTLILQGCLRGSRNSQRKLYEYFYGYALNICLHYSRNREEAVEILNDAFLKVFTKLEQYDPDYPFRGWLRRILIHSAIDYHRRNHKHAPHLELMASADVAEEEIPMPQISPDEDLLPILQQLTPAYRVVFILFVMESYKHHEIAEMLNISVSTSRSNLLRAKEKLRALLEKGRGKSAKTN